MFFYASYSSAAIIPVRVESGGERRRKAPRGKKQKQADNELEELCRSLRLMSERDIDGTVVEVFRTVLVKRGSLFGSTELSRLSRLNRITCIHHLKRLESMGIVEHEGSKYKLRYASLEDIIEHMRESTLSMFEEMEELAKRIDVEMVNEYERQETRRARTAKAKA